MRILYLSPCGQLGGAERCLLDMLASLRRCEPGWQLALIAGKDGPVVTEARRLGVDALVVPYPERLATLGSFGTNPFKLGWNMARALPETLRYAGALRRRIAAMHPDVIHTNGFKMHLLGVWTTRAYPIGKSTRPRVVWHLHDYMTARALSGRLLGLFSGRCAAAIAISRSVARDARTRLGGSTPIRTIPNAVALSRFRPHGEDVDLDALSGLPRATAPLRVGLVATFAKWKGHRIFLEALARPELCDLDIRGYIVGGPIYATANGQHSVDALRSMARELGIERRIGFTGFVENTPAVMRSLDIVVHASTAPEPFGLVIAEAMACGRPVIASLSGGALELFTNGYDAVGVPPGDAAALATAIQRLAVDPTARVRLGRAARATAEARFNRVRLGPQLSECYREITCESSISIAAISTAA